MLVVMIVCAFALRYVLCKGRAKLVCAYQKYNLSVLKSPKTQKLSVDEA